VGQEPSKVSIFVVLVLVLVLEFQIIKRRATIADEDEKEDESEDGFGRPPGGPVSLPLINAACRHIIPPRRVRRRGRRREIEAA